MNREPTREQKTILEAFRALATQFIETISWWFTDTGNSIKDVANTKITMK